MHDKGTIVSIVDTQQSPHNYNMSPSDRTHIADADLFIWVGENLELYLADYIEIYEKSNRVVTAFNIPELLQLTLEDGAADAHIWLSPENASLIANAIVEELVTIDVDNAEFYQQNLRDFNRELMTAKNQIGQIFAETPRQPYIVYHDAFQYFESEFGIKHQFSMVRDPEQQPGIREIASKRNLVASVKPRCLISERGANQQVIETMLNKHMLKKINVDLFVTDSEGHASYLSLLQTLADNFADCLYSQ